MTDTPKTTNPPIYLLTVGIDKYLAEGIVKPLYGCVRDAKLLQSVFRSQFGVPQENIRMLLAEHDGNDPSHELPTGENILAAFREHLTEKAKEWKERNDNSPSPAFVFHFSGHGAICRDKTQNPITFDESILPTDARIAGKYDIRDWQLREYIDELTAYTDNVTIILDCCSSGSGTRDTDEENDSNKRSAPPDNRDQLVYRKRPSAPKNVEKTAGTRSGSPASDSEGSSEGHVLLAACRSYEQASEYKYKEDGTDVKNGAFTFYLAQELSTLPKDRTLTNREVIGRVRAQVQRKYSTQAPQCEGDVHRELFGGATPTQESMFDVTDLANGTFSINAGRVHGVTSGLNVDVYPPGTLTTADAKPKLASIQTLHASSSVCRMADGSVPEIMSRVQPHNAGFAGKTGSVAFDIADRTLKSKLESACADPTLKMVKSPSYADLIVKNVAGRLEIQDPSGARLVATFDLGDTKKLKKALCGITHYHNTMELENKSPGSSLKGALTLEMFEFGFGVALVGMEDELHDLLTAEIDVVRKPTKKKQPSIAVVLADQNPHFVVRYKNGELLIEDAAEKQLESPYQIGPGTVNQIATALVNHAEAEAANLMKKTEGPPPYRVLPTSEGRPIIVENGWYIIRVTNHSNQNLSWDVLAFGHDYSVTPLKSVIKDFDTRDLYGTSTPGHEPRFVKIKCRSKDESFVQATESLKVIGTLKDVSYKFLERSGLALEEDTDSTRSFDDEDEDEYEEDWTTTDLSYLVVRTAPEPTRLSSGSKTTVPQYDFAVSAPSGFGGHVEVESRLQSALASSTPTAAQKLPPIPPAFSTSGNLRPVAIKSSGSVGVDGTDINLSVLTDESAQLSPDTPVSLHVPDSGDGRLMSVSTDGVLFFPLGISADESTAESTTKNDKQVPVTWAPPESVEDPTRDALRTIRLLVYRVLRQTPPELGVHLANVSSIEGVDLSSPARHSTVGESVVSYTTLQNADFSSAKKFALFIHGLGGNTDWMVARAMAEFETRGIEYDAVLTFDYETIATPIRDNAVALATALKDHGFCADDGFELDIFADGSGGLVARSMIEQSDGADYIDRCFMTGTPNNGTPIAHMTRLAPVLGTLAMNSVFPGATAVVGTFIGSRIGNGKGTADLQPNSDFLTKLNASDSTPKTRYFALAGTGPTNDPKTESWAKFIRQSIDSTLNTVPALFDLDHDLLVSVPSATTIRNGKYPGTLLESKCVPGSHFEYFENSAAWDQLSEWVKA